MCKTEEEKLSLHIFEGIIKMLAVWDYGLAHHHIVLKEKKLKNSGVSSLLSKIEMHFILKLYFFSPLNSVSFEY